MLQEKRTLSMWRLNVMRARSAFQGDDPRETGA